MATEQRLIDAMRLETQLAKRMRFGRIEYDDVLAVIAEAPTVDAVEVVRCKDCKFAYINSFAAKQEKAYAIGISTMMAMR